MEKIIFDRTLLIFCLVFQFDWKLSTCIPLKWQQAEDFLEGDIQYIPAAILENQICHIFSTCVFGLDYRWPEKKVPYIFDELTFNSTFKQGKVLDAMKIFHDKTCIRFIPRTLEEDYVEIISDPLQRCYSSVAKIGGSQEISLPDWCLEPYDILHQLMHTIGFFHEHNRFDRDSHVTIHFENIPQRLHKKFAIWNHHMVTHDNQTYDYASVMHFQESLDGMNILTRRNASRIVATSLSHRDVKKINKLYGCEMHETHEHLHINVKTNLTSSASTPHCKTNWFYCGYTLKELNYENVIENGLYFCNLNNVALRRYICSTKCVFEGPNTYCACKIGTMYCGYQLELMYPARGNSEEFREHSLYYCSAPSLLTVNKVCHGFCKPPPDGDSKCVNNKRKQCEFPNLYCGLELISHYGYDAEYYHTLYKCESNGNIIAVESCNNTCEIHYPNSSCLLGVEAFQHVIE